MATIPTATRRQVSNESELNLDTQLLILSTHYGINLTRDITTDIASGISPGLSVIAEGITPAISEERDQRRLELMEDAILGYLRQNNPRLANIVATRIETRRLWDGLDLDNVQLPQREQTSTDPLWVNIAPTIGQALDECRRLPVAERTTRFIEIISQIAELFRVRNDGSGLMNLLGHTYSLAASDPTDIVEHHQINCFSGTIALGLVIMQAARYVHMDNVAVTSPQVASYTLGNGIWDDTGHTILRVGVGSRTFFFDSTNALLAWQSDNFTFDPARNMVENEGMRQIRYMLGSEFAIDSSLISAARLQDRLMDSTVTPDDNTVTAIATMPPLFIPYFLMNIDETRRMDFLRRMGINRIRQIENPIERFRLAATAAVLFRDSNRALATSFGALALRSLEEATASETQLSALPMGSFLNTAIQLVDLMDGTASGEELIRRSRIWMYIPAVATRTTTTIEPPVAATALRFMSRFVVENRDFIALQTPLVQFNILRGLVRTQSIAAAGYAGSPLSRGSDASLSPAAASTELYSMLGIDRYRVLETLRTNANLEFTTMHPADLNGRLDNLFASSDHTAQQLEAEFLSAIYQVLAGTFSRDNIMARRLRMTPQTRAIADILLDIFQPGHFNILLAGDSPVRRAAESLALI
ncbi:MAG: hypothetical protein ABIJ10_00995 [Candidatus Micrarchaeota archaeon]